MSLTPPSSHGLAGVTVEAGSLTTGNVLTIVNESPPIAAWEAPGATPGHVSARISGIPVLLIGETPESDFSATAYVTVTSPPMVIAASGACGTFAISVFNVPDILDTLDIFIMIFVTDQLGVNTGTVSGGFSTPTPVSEYDVDLTGTSATISGTDLVWDDAGATFTSTAGGVYTAMLFVNCSPD